MQTLSAPWRKSSYSANGGQDCVEAASDTGVVLLRDTKDRGRGPVLRLTPRAFADFTTRIRDDAALLPVPRVQAWYESASHST